MQDSWFVKGMKREWSAGRLLGAGSVPARRGAQRREGVHRAVRDGERPGCPGGKGDFGCAPAVLKGVLYKKPPAKEMN